MEMLFLCAIFIIMIIITYDKYTYEPLELNGKCICAFDIDGTITCNENNASKVVDVCKKNNCIIAINTARPFPVYNDLRLSALHLTYNDFKDNFYYGSISDIISAESIAERKVEHMHDLVNRYNISPDKAILFDDNLLNIKRAHEAGFKTILADEHPCGLGPNAHLNTEKILEQ